MVVTETRAAMGGTAVENLGTDITREMLDRAKEGLFTQFEVHAACRCRCR